MARADKGLDTLIGEGGVKVSGGEKQRLSIARALLRKPRLLVFDEATSALDSLTEEEITETIKEISAGNQLITILIAHRLSTIMHADRIYVLEKGRIVEEGPHNELVELKGLYYAMWRQQIGERENISSNGGSSQQSKVKTEIFSSHPNSVSLIQIHETNSKSVIYYGLLILLEGNLFQPTPRYSAIFPSLTSTC
jgi:ABC-type multidrug transport system ATPase subunit